jgi:hypothetical protein
VLRLWGDPSSGQDKALSLWKSMGVGKGRVNDAIRSWEHGVYVRQGDSLRFLRDHPPTTEEVEELVIDLAEAAERFLARHGFGREDEVGEDPDDALPLLQAATVEGRSAVEGGRRARRVQVHRGRAYKLPPRCATWEGYSLHGGVAVGRDA